jgi:hypothetical protein
MVTVGGLVMAVRNWMITDFGKFLRLRGLVTEAVDSIPHGAAAYSGGALEEAYIRVRNEVRGAIGDEDQPEFDRLFPAWQDPIYRDADVRAASPHMKA